MYNKNRHYRKEEIYIKMSAQYQWPKLYKIVKKYTKECLKY